MAPSLIRSKIYRLYAEATASGETLLSRIDAYLSESGATADKGVFLESVSGSGHSVTQRQLSNNGVGDQEHKALLIRELYDRAVTLLAAAGTASPTDAELVVKMLALSPSIRSLRPDFSIYGLEGYVTS